MTGLAPLIRRFAADTRGVSAIILALCVTSMLGFAGLAVDASLWYFDKKSALGAADSAAYSAAVTYAADGQTTAAVTNAEAVAKAVAATYGYANGSNGVTVTVNNPPTTGAHTSSAGAFEVIISKTEPLFFSKLFINGVSVASRAVGQFSTTTIGTGKGGCLVALDPTSAGSINLSNNAQVDAQCGTLSNGTGTSAVSLTGGAKLYTSGVNTPGGINVSNGAQICAASGYNSSCPTATEKSAGSGGTATVDPYAADTLANIEAGDSNYSKPANCPTTSPVSFGSYGATVKTNTGTYVPTNGNSYTINPGVYCGGISVSNGNTLTFNPGIYYIMGGQFSLTSGNNVATSGVTIVLVDDNGAPSVTIGNGGNLSINSPSTGPTAGIAFYGDPANTGTVGFNGGAQITVNGTLYFPKSTLTFNNGTGVGVNSSCTELIGYDISLAGGMNLNLTSCSSYGVKTAGGSTTTNTEAIVE